MPPAAHLAFCFCTASLPSDSSCLRTCSRAAVVALAGAGTDSALSARCCVGVLDVGLFATVHLPDVTPPHPTVSGAGGAGMRSHHSCEQDRHRYLVSTDLPSPGFPSTVRLARN